jgi:hypothetical protein
VTELSTPQEALKEQLLKEKKSIKKKIYIWTKEFISSKLPKASATAELFDILWLQAKVFVFPSSPTRVYNIGLLCFKFKNINT